MQEITVTPLEALYRLIGAASMIDSAECKDEAIYSTLQGELVVAKEVAKALAMAPKQEAPAAMTDDRIFEWAEGYVFTTKGMPHKMTFSRPRFVEAVRTIISHLPVASPAAANGALPELPEEAAGSCEVITGHETIRGMQADIVEYHPAYSADQMRAYGQACAAAGPDAALIKALEEMVHWFGKYPEWIPNPSLSTNAEKMKMAQDNARAALSGAKGN